MPSLRRARSHQIDHPWRGAPRRVPVVDHDRQDRQQSTRRAKVLATPLLHVEVVHVVANAERHLECPTADAFGFACGPAPLVDHGTTAPGRWRSPETSAPWKCTWTSESGLPRRQRLRAHQPSRRRPAPHADGRPFTIETDGTRKLGAATGSALAEAAAALWANCGAGGSV